MTHLFLRGDLDQKFLDEYKKYKESIGILDLDYTQFFQKVLDAYTENNKKRGKK